MDEARLATLIAGMLPYVQEHAKFVKPEYWERCGCAVCLHYKATQALVDEAKNVISLYGLSVPPEK